MAKALTFPEIVMRRALSPGVRARPRPFANSGASSPPASTRATAIRRRPTPSERTTAGQHRRRSAVADGDRLSLRCRLFGADAGETPGWEGPRLSYYQSATSFPREARSFTGCLTPPHPAEADTNTPADWAQGNRDPARGRRATYPALGPVHPLSTGPRDMAGRRARGATADHADNMLTGVLALFASARRSINLKLPVGATRCGSDAGGAGQGRGACGRAAGGGPTGGLTDESRWAAQQLVEAGAKVRFMVSDVGDTRQRYSNVHAKFAIVDGSTLLVGTENFTSASLPATPATATRGRRGYAVILSDPCSSPAPSASSPLIATPVAATSSPGNPTILNMALPRLATSLRPRRICPAIRCAIRHRPSSAMRMRPGCIPPPRPASPPARSWNSSPAPRDGDVILVQQLYEQPFWGAAHRNPTLSPNPRLEALIAAARRGASVRLLLDKFFDVGSDARSNRATVRYVTDLAQAEGLDMQARLGNPAGLGVHPKLHLLAIGSERWAVVSSVNGSEASNKLCRQLGVALRSPAAFAHLADTFWADWEGGVRGLPRVWSRESGVFWACSPCPLSPPPLASSIPSFGGMIRLSSER